MKSEPIGLWLFAVLYIKHSLFEMRIHLRCSVKSMESSSSCLASSLAVQEGKLQIRNDIYKIFLFFVLDCSGLSTS